MQFGFVAKLSIMNKAPSDEGDDDTDKYVYKSPTDISCNEVSI